MKPTIALTLFLLFIVTINAETFTEAKLRSFQKKHTLDEVFSSMGDSQFGKNLLNMLSLRFQTSQKFDQLNNALADLITQIQTQQRTEDNEYETSSGAYTATIKNQDVIITSADENIKAYEGQLRDKKQAQSQKYNAKVALQSEGDGITKYLQALAQTRTQEKQAFETRVKNSESLINGIDRTISLFRGQTENAEVDQDTVQKILALLDAIKASLTASIADDTTAENNAATKYDEFNTNRNARLDEINGEVTQLEIDLNKLDAEITTLQTNLDSEKSRKSNAEDLKTKTQTSLDDLTQKYNSNKSVRANQISLLSQVNVALKSNPEEVQKYLNKY